MNGRFFDKKVVEAYISDGTEKFKKSSEKSARLDVGDEGEEDNEEGKRLDKFGTWLEGGEG